MSRIERFEDIEAWKKARVLCARIYQVTQIAPFSKDYGLCNQIQRASVSVMSNIAEGFERDGNKEFTQFLSIAKGSVGEVRAQIYVALDSGYITQEAFNELYALCIDTSSLLSGFMAYLKRSDLSGRKNN